MIDSLTGMKPGERYVVESLERTRSFPGFFLDGKYYLGPELMTAVGWLEGQQFFYDELDPSGEPVFPDRIAGTIEGLILTLIDGARLKLNKVRYNAQVDLRLGVEHSRQSAPSSGNLFGPPGGQRLAKGGWRAAKHRPSLLIALGATMLLGGLLFALNRRERRERSR
ncbi:short chain dehydrogenase [Pseudomonas sp. ZS1P83]